MKRIAPDLRQYKTGDVIDVTKKISNPKNKRVPFMKRGTYLITNVNNRLIGGENISEVSAVTYGNQERVDLDGKTSYLFYQNINNVKVESDDVVIINDAHVVGLMKRKEVIQFVE